MELQLTRRVEVVDPIELPDDVFNAIHQAIGAASMCWSEPPLGIFDLERAGMIAFNLCYLIGQRMAGVEEKPCPICGQTHREK